MGTVWCRQLAVVGALLGTAVLACAGLATSASASPLARIARACRGATLSPSTATAGAVAHATLCMVDQIRAEHRLPRLHVNKTLEGLADSQVTNMIELDYFADVRPTGQTPLALVAGTSYARSDYVSVGQNIAWGSGRQANARSIVSAWMHSPPHRSIILDGRYRDGGVAVTAATPAVVHAGAPGATYAMEFGVRHG